MNITVKRIGIADILPKRLSVSLKEGSNVRDLILLLSEEYGDELQNELLLEGKVHEDVLIMLNGESLHQPGMSLDSLLHEGDELLFSVMVYGG